MPCLRAPDSIFSTMQKTSFGWFFALTSTKYKFEMTKPLEKGNELENAVKAIEHVILQSSPGLEENT